MRVLKDISVYSCLDDDDDDGTLVLKLKQFISFH